MSLDLADLYASRAAHVRNLIRRKLPTASPETVEDLVQDTFLRALRRIETYRERGSPHSWLLSIAAHLCLDHIRRAVRRSECPVAPHHALTTDAGNDRHIDRIDIWGAVETLDEPERRLVIGHYRDNLSRQQALGQSWRGGSQTRTHARAMAALSRRLEVTTA